MKLTAGTDPWNLSHLWTGLSSQRVLIGYLFCLVDGHSNICNQSGSWHCYPTWSLGGWLVKKQKLSLVNVWVLSPAVPSLSPYYPTVCLWCVTLVIQLCSIHVDDSSLVMRAGCRRFPFCQSRCAAYVLWPVRQCALERWSLPGWSLPCA